MLKYYVNNSCIGCTLCASTCPAVFRMTDDNVAEAYTDPTTDAEAADADTALDGCPVDAIEKRG